MSVNETAQHVYEFGPFRLVTGEKKLFRGQDEEVRLSTMEFRILLYLIENHERAVSVNKLADKFFKAVETNNVHQKISGIRKALGEKRGENKYIQTIEDSYRFVAQNLVVTVVPVEPVEPNEPNEPVEPTPEPHTNVPPQDVRPQPSVEPPQVVEPQPPTVEPPSATEVVQQPVVEPQRTEVEPRPVEDESQAARPSDSSTPPPPADEVSSLAQHADEVSSRPQPAAGSVLSKDSKSKDEFRKWLFGDGMLLTWLLLFWIVATLFVSVVGIRRQWAWTNMAVRITHIGFLLTALLYPLRSPKEFLPLKELVRGGELKEEVKTSTGYESLREWVYASKIAEKSLERFKRFWQGVLITWLLLYASLSRPLARGTRETMNAER